MIFVTVIASMSHELLERGEVVAGASRSRPLLRRLASALLGPGGDARTTDWSETLQLPSQSWRFTHRRIGLDSDGVY
jgi:hypothetical protein